MSFGLLHVAPLLPEFLATFSEVSVDLHLSDAMVDVIGEGFDAAIRIAVLSDSSLVVRRLCEMQRYLVSTVIGRSRTRVPVACRPHSQSPVSPTPPAERISNQSQDGTPQPTSGIGPRLPSWATRQFDSYLGNTGRAANVVATAAFPPIATVPGECW
jgi:DNA-binding transcriptional LysR family regulator